MKFTPVSWRRNSVTGEISKNRRTLTVDLYAIDLSSCARCVPSADVLQAAVNALKPAAEILGIDIVHKARVIETREEALAVGLKSSPTILVNGRDIAGELRESVCESCGDIAGGSDTVDCREWLYRGEVHCTPPAAMLVEAIMNEMLHIDSRPCAVVETLERLPENLERFFASKSKSHNSSGCGSILAKNRNGRL